MYSVIPTCHWTLPEGFLYHLCVIIVPFINVHSIKNMKIISSELLLFISDVRYHRKWIIGIINLKQDSVVRCSVHSGDLVTHCCDNIIIMLTVFLHFVVMSLFFF